MNSSAKESIPSRKTLCIYGSASDGVDKEYHADIVNLGLEAARNGCDLCFGGGTTGHMGAMLEGMYKGGAYITAIIPDYILSKEMRDRPGRTKGGENPATWIDEVYILKGEDQRAVLQARQRLMQERADVIIGTTGGDVTQAEIYEVLGWKKYNLISTPLVLFNPNGQWDSFIREQEEIRNQGFNTSHSKRTGDPTPSSPYVVVTSIEEAVGNIQIEKPLNGFVRPSGRPKATRHTTYIVEAPKLVLSIDESLHPPRPDRNKSPMVSGAGRPRL